MSCHTGKRCYQVQLDLTWKHAGFLESGVYGHEAGTASTVVYSPGLGGGQCQAGRGDPSPTAELLRCNLSRVVLCLYLAA